MRGRPLLILALALFGAALTAGFATAQQPTAPAVATGALPECSNTVDDDGDGLVDLDDPDCNSDPAGMSESPGAAPAAPPLTTTVPPAATTTTTEPTDPTAPGSQPGDQ